MLEDAEVLESAGRRLLKQRAICAAEEGFVGVLLGGGAIFLFFLIKPFADWADFRMSELTLFYFKIAGVGMAIFALLGIGLAFVSLLRVPKAPVTPGGTCRQFYEKLFAWGQFDQRYLSYVCLTTHAKEEYGSIGVFLKKWEKPRNEIKAVFDHVYVELHEAGPEGVQGLVTLYFKASDRGLSSYICRVALVKIGTRWYIDAPLTDCTPKIRQGEAEKT